LSWLDSVLGRTKPVKSSLDQLFGMSTAEVTLNTELELKATGKAAISFRPVSSGEFQRLQHEIEELLKASTRDAPLEWHTTADSYGFQWVALHSSDFSNVVTTIHMISHELQDSNFGEQLLASVFEFKDPAGRSVFWVYNYKRGAFYPFVPTGGENRDNAFEMRLCGVMKQELQIEEDAARWYPIWGIPLAS
jgi:hypothetical protein